MVPKCLFSKRPASIGFVLCFDHLLYGVILSVELGRTGSTGRVQDRLAPENQRGGRHARSTTVQACLPQDTTPWLTLFRDRVDLLPNGIFWLW